MTKEFEIKVEEGVDLGSGIQDSLLRGGGTLLSFNVV